MPLVELDDDVPPPPAPAIREVAAPDYKGVTVDTKVERVENLLEHVEGSSWVVRYYSQVLNLDSATSGQQQSLSGVNQQYTRIADMELKVNSALSYSQDPSTKQSIVTGSATVYPFIIPNAGDMFVADLGNGQEAVLEITRSERKSVFRRTVHQIEYKVVDYSVPTRIADLEQKTVRRLVYDRDFHTLGQNPLLFEEEHEILLFLRRSYKDLLRRYMEVFFSREFMTLIVPGQANATYDPYIVHAFLQCFDVWDFDRIQEMKEYNRDEDDALRATQVWTAMLQRDITYLADCFVQYGTVSARTFTREPRMYGLFHSGFVNVIYPVDPVMSVDYAKVQNTRLPESGSVLDEAPQSTRPSLTSLIGTPVKSLAAQFKTDALDGFIYEDSDGNVFDPQNPPPLIHKAMSNNYYVFSKAFYENDQTPGAQSQLELLARQYLKGEPIPNKYLKLMIDDMKNWNTMDRFYFTPILLILVKAAIKDL